MYLKMYIVLIALALSGFVGSSSIPRIARSTIENCPVILAKTAAECEGRVSDCWSPGQYDLDCDNGASVCCFDGCANVCSGKPKQCRTEYQPKFENVTKEMCSPEEQPPACTIVTKEDCHDECRDVEKLVPTIVMEDVCETVNEPVCEVVETETCAVPEFGGDNPVCPLIHLKPVEECQSEAPSNCWSPGVPDVDCPNNGLCCFNGCANRCVKNCYNEVSQECITVDENECHDELAEACEDVTIDVPCEPECSDVEEQQCSSVSVPVIKQVAEQVCKEKTVPDCKEVKSKKCEGSKGNSYKPYNCVTVTDEVCVERIENVCEEVVKSVTEEVEEERCEPITRQACKTGEGCTATENRCTTVSKTVCDKVPRQQCREVTKEVCPECVKKVVRNQKCTDKPKEVCYKEPKTVNESVNETECEKVCIPREEEICEPVPPKIVCNQIVKQMSYPVPIWVCD